MDLTDEQWLLIAPLFPPLPPWTVRPGQAGLIRWAVKTSPQSRLTLEEGDPNVGSDN